MNFELFAEEAQESRNSSFAANIGLEIDRKTSGQDGLNHQND